MSHNYNCFIVSPIGEDGSDIRRNANELLEYVIQPALKICGFREELIVRADQLTTPGANITNEILNYLGSADLCIVDLTGLNANVMYECGIRQGNGRPFIIMAPAGKPLPFDLAHRRAILFDLSSLQKAHQAQTQLTKFVDALLKEGFVRTEGENSITTMSEALRRIEKRLDEAILRANTADGFSRSSSETLTEILDTLSPIQAFNYALTRRDVALGEQVLPLIKPQVSLDYFLDHAVFQLAGLGSEVAAQTIKDHWEYIQKNMSLKQEYEGISSFINYCNRADREVEYLDFVNAAIDSIARRAEGEGDSEIQAYILNQKNRVYYGAYTSSGQKEKHFLEIAMASLKKALEYKSDDSSFHYNLAICLRAKGQMNEATDEITRCLDLQTEGEDDADHLRTAYEIYKQANDMRAKEVFLRLEKANKYLAAIARRE